MHKYLTRSARVAVAAALLSAAGMTPTALAGETVVDRSAFSTTVQVGDAFKTRTYPEQVNFKDVDGDWSAIDRSLEANADGSVSPAAVNGDAVIPTTLTKPVVLEHDGRTVSFRLLGADANADRDVSGSKASFDDALAGVDVSYKVRPSGLKELLQLSSRSSARSFSYDVRADSDLNAAIVGTDLVFTDSAGEERFRVTAPLAWDSAALAETANALTLSVSKTGDRQWRLTMRADDAWLDDPARVYPVTLDPDYYWVEDGALRFHGANQDCAMAGNDLANQNRCAYTALQIGYGNNRPYKSVVKFDVASAIPSYARVTASRFLAWQFPSSQKFEVSSRLRTVTSPWDNTATWNKRIGSTAWTTPGGDVSTDATLTGDPITIAASGYWSYWPAPVAAVSGWIKGTLPNYGFQVSTDLTTPTVKSAYEFTSTDGAQNLWPALEVTWVPDTTGPTNIGASGLGSPEQPTLNGNQVLNITATADDDISGVKSVALVIDGTVVGNPAQVTCTATNCPLSTSGQLSLSAAGLTEGQHTAEIRSTDLAGNVATSTSWTLTVDKSAPVFASTTAVSATPGDTGTWVTWSDASDPVLAGGAAGSGVRSYDYRYTVGTVTSAWANVAANQVQVPTINGSATVQLVAIDATGNRSATYSKVASTQSMTGLVSGNLYRDPANLRVYLYENGRKHWISSPAAADQNGFDLSTVTDVSAAALSPVPEGQSVNYTEDLVDDEGDDVEFDPDATDTSASKLSGSSFATAVPTQGNYACKGGGATVRNGGKKYVMGYCYANASITITGKHTFELTRSDGTKRNVDFAKGQIGGNFAGCGFMQSLARLESGTKTLNGRDCGYLPINENVFASVIFPSDADVRGASQDQEMKSDRTCRRYRNVNLRTEVAAEPQDIVRNRSGDIVNVPRNATVQIRYRTVARDYVMTRYPPSSSGSEDRYAAWAFMRADCFKHMPPFAFTARNAPGGAPPNKNKFPPNSTSCHPNNPTRPSTCPAL